LINSANTQLSPNNKTTSRRKKLYRSTTTTTKTWLLTGLISLQKTGEQLIHGILVYQIWKSNPCQIVLPDFPNLQIPAEIQPRKEINYRNQGSSCKIIKSIE